MYIKKYINLKNIIIFLIIFPVWVSSFMGLYEDRQKIQEKIISYFNAKHFNDALPEELQDVYESEAYLKSQAYKKTNHTFFFYSSSFSLILTLSFFFLTR